MDMKNQHNHLNNMSHISDYDNSQNMIQNNHSFQDYLQNSAQNLSFSNLNQNSFEIDDDHNHNLPVTQVKKQSNYIPQSFLSKPLDESNYNKTEQTSLQWKYNLTKNNLQDLNKANTLIAMGSKQNQQKGAKLLQNAQSLWDSDMLNNNDHRNNILNPDKEQVSSDIINNYNRNFNENGLFREMKSNSTMDYYKPSLKSHLRQNCLNSHNFAMDMEEEYPNTSRYNHPNNNLMDIEGNTLKLSDTPIKLQKNPHIIMNYDNYQQNIKTYQRNKSTNDYSDMIDTNTQRNVKQLNYQLSNNDVNCKYFEFSPIKQNQNIPFASTHYLEERFENKIDFGSFSSHSDDLSQKIQPENSKLSNSKFIVGAAQDKNQSNSTNSIQTSQPCICNCKKTKCLKLYCECFSKLGYCGENCHCHDCKNKPENEVDRQNAIKEAKFRNQDAFQPKAEQEFLENKRKTDNDLLKKGCNCRKTKCLKKYCECFNAGVYCNGMCKCDSCENNPRNAAFIFQKKNGSCSQQQIIEHHTKENCPPSLVVSQYQDEYYQRNYSSHQLHNTQHNNSSGVNKTQLHQQTTDLTNTNQIGLTSTYTFQQNNHLNSPFIDSQLLYRSCKPQEGVALEIENEDSYQQFYRKQDKKYFFNKATNQRKQKKLIIKNKRENLENSDEEILSQVSSSQKEITLMRIKRNSIESKFNDNKNLSSCHKQIQKKQIEDMEKKLKQIQQVQQLLQQQQLLKQEKEKFLISNRNSSKQIDNSNLEVSERKANEQKSSLTILDINQNNFNKQKEGPELQITQMNQEQESNSFKFISPHSIKSNHNKDEEIDESDEQDIKEEFHKSHLILNCIKKNKKRYQQRKESIHQQLSEEKKQQSPAIENEQNIFSTSYKKQIPCYEDQENSVSNKSQFNQFSQQQQFYKQQLNPHFRNRLNSENYEQIRQKSILNSQNISKLSSNPTQCSQNLFNPSSYNLNNDSKYSQYNKVFPYDFQSIKENISQTTIAP